MKKFWILAVLLLPVLAFGQDMVFNSFDTAPADTNYWMYFEDLHGGVHYGASDNSDSLKSFVNVSYVTDIVHEGTGSMKLDWSAHNSESWGGYAKLEHWNPDSNAVYDLSAYDSLEFWYYIETPPATANSVTFRLNLHEVSDAANGNKTYDVTECEYYYGLLTGLLDNNTPGWNRFVIPLKDGRGDATLDEWNGGAFNRTGWSGVAGNDTFDKDKIKGFSFEFSIGGAGEGNHESGVMYIDYMAATGFSVQPIVFFNGKTVASNMAGFAWGGALTIAEGEGFTEGTNALVYTHGNEWAGAGWNIDPVFNMQYAWGVDSLKFTAKADEGAPALRIQMESGAAPDKVAFLQAFNDDGLWHDYAIPLSDFYFQDGSTTFDTSAVKVLQFMAEGNGVSGKKIYFDNLWTGSPVIDVISPDAPTGVAGTAATGYNLVIWQDVPGESGETYAVYASTQPITDITAPGVDLIAGSVAENTQSATHYLYYPLEDRDVTYYYAVTCTDNFGNVSETAGVSASGTTNLATGIGTISLDPPADFAADGDLAEWDASGIVPIVMDETTAFVSPKNSASVDDDNDLSANVWLAIDDDFLYIAADVIDNSYNWGAGDWWLQDVMECFIGLYDRRGPKHKSFLDGAEPDYKIVMQEEKVWEEMFASDIFDNGTENYFFTDLGGADYVIEAKVPLDSLAKGAANRFHPARGMRIPLELTFHDNDNGTWDGNLTTSAYNDDNAHTTPTVWFETWIGDTTDTTSPVEIDGNGTVVRNFKLKQNYPNPFNPETSIEYSVPKSGVVTIELFNMLGQSVRTLVNEQMTAGTYTVRFNAADLPSGVYFYRLKAAGKSQMKKMMLMK